ncbi:TetR/AcrR family transcriptional regulator [Bradyrhizobium erythrophlei]|uniref:TetR/AcrR family transcriptional regulator n=1 Tax=Bradyrhizobium erythrophlei TaxID=1437360 RepID=UPI0035EBD17C
MNKPTTKSDLTRAQIIEGALRALSKTGVIGTTTRKIAAEAGVRLATLHYHFDSKSALLVAVLEKLIEQIAERMHQDRVAEDADMDQCIEQLLRGSWRAIAQTKAIQIVHYELTLYALREGIQWLAERQYEAYLRLYRDRLAVANRGSNQLSAAACTALARFILAGIDGLILQELAKPSAERSRRGIDALVTAAQAYARQLAQ